MFSSNLLFHLFSIFFSSSHPRGGVRKCVFKGVGGTTMLVVEQRHEKITSARRKKARRREREREFLGGTVVDIRCKRAYLSKAAALCGNARVSVYYACGYIIHQTWRVDSQLLHRVLQTFWCNFRALCTLPLAQSISSFRSSIRGFKSIASNVNRI